MIKWNDFSFGTKAETLSFLYEHQAELSAKVFKSLHFSVERWGGISEEICDEIERDFSGISNLILRSSAKVEDSETESMAGKYESIICENKRDSVRKTIEQVIASYGTPQLDDQVLVQRAADDVECSGVAFSMDPNTGGRYFVINYDDITGSTSSITSGTSKSTKLFYWFSGNKKYPADERLAQICHVLKNLTVLTNHDALDMEFLFSKGEMYVLQLRPLILKAEKADALYQEDVLIRIQGKIRYENTNKPFLFGRRTMYGVMPDWNPAEMIGIHPHNLATSLYKEIITDEVWAYQRDNYGYKRLRSFPLMVDLCGFPYIDVRVSFNSFIPADLDSSIAEKLVNYYLDRLEESPDKHDKVEFDIVFSCYTFDLKKRIQVLKQYGFSEKEIDLIITSLRNLTRKITDSENGLWRKDVAKLSVLENRRDEIESSNLRPTDKAFWLLEDCKRYGTLPFAGLARAGFIAVQLLKSMVSEGIITEEENSAFMNDLQTVNSSMKGDFAAMTREDFLDKYGFLRPGTYDICSARYDEAPDTYFDWTNKESPEERKNDNFRLSLVQMERIRDTLIEHEMGEDVLGLFSFIKRAIEGREFAKFVFTRNLSDIIKYIGEWGGELGFTREELSFMDIDAIKSVYNGAVDEHRTVQNSIDSGKQKYEEGLGVVLPPILADVDSVTSFFVPDSQPTYVTQGRVEGEMCLVSGQDKKEINGKILLIESADPGYDWIFSHQIKGFITKYGGANSHMAIRAGELALPAVVGAGDRLYSELLNASVVEIDAPKKQVRILR